MLINIFSATIRPHALFFQLEIPSDAAAVKNALTKIWAEHADTINAQHGRRKSHKDDLYLIYLSHGVDIDPLNTLRVRLHSSQPESQYAYDWQKIKELTDCDVDQIQWILQIGLNPPELLLAAEKTHLATLAGLTNSPAPSSIFRGRRWYQHQRDNPIHNGRPFHLHSTPLAMYHPVFADLKSKLSDLSRLPTPNARRRTLVAQLLVTAGDIYETEDARLKSTMEVMRGLLGDFETNVDILDESGARVAHADCIKSHIREDGIECVTVVGEFRNEPDGHPDVQAAATYARRIAHPNYTKIRNSTCCPAIILSFAGSYLRIYGVVFVDVLILQPLTNVIDLADDPVLKPQLLDVAKILDAVRGAISDLARFYTTVPLSETPLLPRLMPSLHPHPAFPHDLVLEERFHYKGTPPHASHSLFTGSFGGSRVLVKLCTTYNSHAHALLAGAEPPLAPKLHFFGEVQGGMKVAIMDFLDFEDAHHHFPSQPLPPPVLRDISRAINILHAAGLVFGDLRRPNVMVVPQEGTYELGGMLVDFEWCGEAGEARYTDFLNVSGEIRWPDGVGPGEVMQTGHDDFMFTRL